MGWNRRSGLAAALLLLVGNLPSGGCAKSSGVRDDVAFSCHSDPVAPRIGVNTFTVTLSGKGGALLTGAHVAIEGDMTHPGMSPVFGDAREIAPGRYQGTLDLTMRGDWTILFHVTLASGRMFEGQLQIRNLQAT
jgi:YtkA-like